MRKFFFWFGVTAAAGICLIVAGFAYFVHVASGLDTESQIYAESSVLAVTSHWDAQQMLLRASPQWKTSVSDAKLASMFAWFTTLGPLVQAQACRGSAFIEKSVGVASSTTAKYDCAAKYQNGNAQIALGLIKLDGKWMLNGFHVNSDALLPNQPGLKL